MSERRLHQAVAKLLARIEEEPDSLSELTIDAAARASCVSTFYLQHIIRRDLGCSFTQLVRQKRVAHANRLLLDQSGLTIKEVAGACGYRPSTMYRHFKLELGMSPSDVRRNGAKVSQRRHAASSYAGTGRFRPST